jgi:hypothetical protein
MFAFAVDDEADDEGEDEEIGERIEREREREREINGGGGWCREEKKQALMTQSRRPIGPHVHKIKPKEIFPLKIC